jgi:hypothetical protein
MTSQLNVDTIVDKAGSGGTNVKVANTSTYVSDGGAVTQNTVQGLVKSFVRTSTPGTVTDSFNVSSNSDVGSGQHKSIYTNNMSGAENISVATGCDGAVNTNTIICEITSNESASQIEVITLLLSGTSSHSLSDHHVAITIHGDLA